MAGAEEKLGELSQQTGQRRRVLLILLATAARGQQVSAVARGLDAARGTLLRAAE
jgi:hypothetical protein